MPARCLSVHAGYRCRHSGECCSGVFAIPAEPRVAALVGRLHTGGAGAPARLFVSRDDTPETLFVAVRPDGPCVFLDVADGLCALHRRDGADALPSACRHFPRVFLRDRRGTFLALSHFCPTAAGLLLDDGPLTIVDADPPLALDDPIEGFDAAGALPPLLRPGLLADLDGYDAWERAAVQMFARPDVTHTQALDAIAAATETVRQWKPDGSSLAACVAAAFRDVGALACALDDPGHHARLDLVDAAGPRQAGCAIQRPVPFDDLWEQYVAPAWAAFDRPLARFLAAKLFGHRIAYEGRGLRSIVEWLRLSLAVVRNETARVAAAAGDTLNRELFVEAIRGADLILVHRIDSASLARSLERVERQPC